MIPKTHTKKFLNRNFLAGYALTSKALINSRNPPKKLPFQPENIYQIMFLNLTKVKFYTKVDILCEQVTVYVLVARRVIIMRQNLRFGLVLPAGQF